MKKPRRLRWVAISSAVLAGIGWAGVEHWIATAKLPPLVPPTSATVIDREGHLLRAYQVEDGLWRLPVRLAELDADFIEMLITYEDRRFRDHPGVDLRAILRAAGQAVVHGRAVSGASTLTMQAVRLMTGTPTRSFGAKLEQIRLALALERRLTKAQILELYLTLAPYGGNIEGVRAASLAWFGKEPRRLTPAQAALLVALPQSPVARRPDRDAARAKAARDRVLARAVRFGTLGAEDATAARTERVPMVARPFPQLAPHVADRLVTAGPSGGEHVLSLDRALQRKIEALVRDQAAALPAPLSLAVMIADHGTGQILASVGSPGYNATDREGFVDMTRAVRSPGSTLKPLIYGLAFDAGLAHPESLIEDRPIAFGAYVPTNFDDDYHGTVSVRAALQRSLNVPAVTLLDAVGPARLMAGIHRAGAQPVLPPGRAPGLAIGLGGIGLTLEDLMGIYTAIARGGESIPLTIRARRTPTAGRRILGAGSAWQVADILAGAPAPVAASNGQLAFKTGTSYGHRDAWAIGFDGAHVIGVWMGRADAAPVPGMTGIREAAPVLFKAMSRLKTQPRAFASPPEDTLMVTNAELPLPLRHVHGPRGRPVDDGPKIAFPPNGAHVAVSGSALPIKIRDGAPPFTWLIDGRPVAASGLEREILWRPEGRGYAAISVIDARGASARAQIFVD